MTRVARRSGLLRALAEIGVVGDKPATRQGAVEFRRALGELGTTYIKLGQLLSSRPDLLPDVYIEELSKLVDQIEPVSYALIEPVIAADVGLEPFAEIDPEPLATASIAQIHTALLKTGRRVVVKVRRPGIVEQVELSRGAPRRRSCSRVTRRRRSCSSSRRSPRSSRPTFATSSTSPRKPTTPR